jgi:hypothetical protein
VQFAVQPDDRMMSKWMRMQFSREQCYPLKSFSNVFDLLCVRAIHGIADVDDVSYDSDLGSADEDMGSEQNEGDDIDVSLHSICFPPPPV